MNHRRLASLALAAAVVLLLGISVRGRLERTNQSPPAAPPSEASALQQLSHEGLLRRASGFVAERASNVARFVVYVPRSAAAGIRWGGDTVLSAGLVRPIDVSTTPAVDSTTPPIRELGDSTRSDWLLVVGRAPSGATLSMAAAAVGRARARCDSRDVDELLLNVPLAGALAGAGVFDIEGALVGVVIRCGERLAAIPTRQITALLAQRDGSASRADALGASFASLDSVSRAYFGVDTGALVVAVRRGSVAQSVDLRPGDLLLSIDGAPVTTAAGASRALTSRSDAVHRVVRLRGGARSVLRVGSSSALSGAQAEQRASAFGFTLASAPRTRGVAVADVQPGLAAHVAGLRAGDRLTRIGFTDVASPVDVERLLRAAPAGPIFLAFDRDSVEHGTLVRR